MKQILIFIGLKIIEIGSFIFIPYYIGKLFNHFDTCFFPRDDECCKFDFWIYGLMGTLVGLIVLFLVAVCLGVIGLGLYQLCVANWQWAGGF